MTGFAEDGRRVDHAAEARRALDGAEGHYWDESPEQVALYLQKAQAEATPALVEQQRIANLIALGSFRVVASELPPFRGLVVVPRGLSDYDLEPHQEIREALGL